MDAHMRSISATLCGVLRADMRVQGVTFAVLGSHLGITQQAISNMLREKRLPDKYWKRIADYMGPQSPFSEMVSRILAVLPEDDGRTLGTLSENFASSGTKPLSDATGRETSRRRGPRPSALGIAAIEAFTEAVTANQISEDELLRLIARCKGIVLEGAGLRINEEQRGE